MNKRTQLYARPVLPPELPTPPNFGQPDLPPIGTAVDRDHITIALNRSENLAGSLERIHPLEKAIAFRSVALRQNGWGQPLYTRRQNGWGQPFYTFHQRAPALQRGRPSPSASGWISIVRHISIRLHRIHRKKHRITPKTIPPLPQLDLKSASARLAFIQIDIEASLQLQRLVIDAATAINPPLGAAITYTETTLSTALAKICLFSTFFFRS